jgi:hypothetical protein
MICQPARDSFDMTRLCGLGAILVLLLAAAPAAADAGASPLRLDSAAFILSDSAEPPPDSAAWQAQALPDNWLGSRPGVSGYGWYRLRFDLPAAPDMPYAVYVPLLECAGALYVNGVFAGQAGAFAQAARTEQTSAAHVPGGRRSGLDFRRACSPFAKIFCMPAPTPSFCVCG